MKIGFLDMGSWFNVKNNFFINSLKHNFEIYRVGPYNFFEVIFHSIDEEFIEYSNLIAANKKYI